MRELLPLLRSRLWADLSPRGLGRAAVKLAIGRRDVYALVSKWALERPDAVAVRDDERTLSWAELHEASLRVAANLRAGQRVAVILDHSVDTFVAMAGVFEAGAVPCPISPQSPPAERERKLADLRADRVIDAETLPGLLQRKPRYRLRLRGQTDLLLSTSGTTGRSKATRMNLNKAGPLAALRYIAGFDVRAGDVLYTPCPLYHAAPLLLTGLFLLTGNEIRVGHRFSPDALAEVTHAFLVPTLMSRLLDTIPPPRTPRLRALISGGAALRPALKTRLLERFGPVLYDFYGATELGVVSIANPADLAAAPESVGRILPGVRVELRDDAGNPVGGGPGELFVAGDTTSEGYDGEPGGEWKTAGDIAKIVDGRLFIVDRKRDVIITGGVNVFPRDVEEIIEAAPGVKECAVLGVPDERWGEAVVAFVVGPTLGLKEFCAARMSPAMVPKAFHPVPEIPRNPTGKVLRRQLREQLGA